MAQFYSEDEEITGINVTPFVDVMLVLLIVFMATTTYMVQQSIQVKLPEAESGKSVMTKKNLTFVVDRDSHIFVNGRPVEFSDLKKYIDEERQKDKGEEKTLQALISADKNTPHGSVIKLIDEVQKNGIKEFALHVESKAASVQ
jgi:biopolymer transport protein ExbD